MTWRDEKNALLATIQRQEEKTVALTKRFKLLQQTLKEQQKLLDRYQRALSLATSDNAKSREEMITPTIGKKRSQSSRILTKRRMEDTGTVNKSSVLNHTWMKKKTAGSSNLETIAEVSVPIHDTKEKTKEISKPSAKRTLASTWAEEKQRMAKKPKWEQAMEQAGSGTSSKKNNQTERTSDQPKNFAYIEVVRNRAERKALPGHDCIDCKKYYNALGEIGAADAAAQKAKCSRHRARFEPYETPDDFWRLSFPDSELQ